MLSWIPLIATIIFVWFYSRKLWVKLVGAIFIYLILAVGIAISIPLLNNSFSDSFSSGDAHMAAGMISETLAIALLRIVIDIPIIGLAIWLAIRRFRD